MNININKERLLDTVYFEKIKAVAEEYISLDMFGEAFSLAKNLENALNSNSEIKNQKNDLYREYLKIITKLRWVGLNILKEQDVVELFQNNFTKIYKIPNFDVWSKLKIVLISIIILEDRDKLKADIRNALANNKEKLTKNKILINGKEEDGTVGNWILDYKKNLGSGKVDKLKLSQYLINGENIKKLDFKEKAKVKVLFNLFEKLKLSSLTLEGVEEEIPIDEEYGRGVIVEGVPEFYKEDDKQKKLFDIADQVIRMRDNKGFKKEDERKVELKSLASKYPAGSLERKAVEEEIDRLNRR